jgi:serine/threonine protein kinase
VCIMAPKGPGRSWARAPVRDACSRSEGRKAVARQAPKCPQCGKPVEVDPAGKHVVCPYCQASPRSGSRKELPDQTDPLIGQTLGTPLYMPPDAARGRPLDARSDLYSLGATFYQAIAGRAPFDGQTPAQVILQHAEAPVPPLEQLAPDTPAELCRIIHRLLRKDPTERYPSAEALLEDLGRVETGGAWRPAAAGPSVQERRDRQRRRRRLARGVSGEAGVS